MGHEPEDLEIRDANGKLVGAATGDREWVERIYAEWRAAGIVADAAPRITKPLKVIEGGKA